MTAADRTNRKVFAAIVAGLVLAFIAAVAGVLNGLQVRSASAADVQRNAVLIEQVRALEEAGNRDVAEHRERNEELHADLCRLVLQIAQARDIDVEPCAPALVNPSAHDD